MSAFQDMVSRDREVLLNLDELGENHDIDGVNVVCIIDTLQLKEPQGSIDYTMSQSNRILFAKCEDIPKRKGYGAELMVDGIPYIVQSWNENMGMAEITLSITFNS